MAVNFVRGLTRAQRTSMSGALTHARAQQRAKMRDLARVAEGGIPAPNFHTHIGRPVVVRTMPDGSPVFAWERAPSIHGKGQPRIKYEYVPIFADPTETARVMIRAAARKATLDAKRAAKADRVAATEGRRMVKRGLAELDRGTRTLAHKTRQTRAVTSGRRSWTLPRALRERVASHAE